MADKTKLTRLTLETSPALQEYLDHEHQLHLQMIEEQKQLEDLRKQENPGSAGRRRKKKEIRRTRNCTTKGLGRTSTERKRKENERNRTTTPT